MSSKHFAGYGIQLPIEDDDNQSIWDDVDDNFPLLDFCIAGDYWNKKVQNSLVLVRSTVEEGYVLRQKEDISESERIQLEEFIMKYAPGVEPTWFSAIYDG